MWKKIESVEDFKSMKKGTLLLKYLGNGIPKDIAPPTCTIDSTIADEVSLSCALTTEETFIDQLNAILIQSPLHRDLQKMINEKIWWYKPTGQNAK